jgi:hypothetical protein
VKLYRTAPSDVLVLNVTTTIDVDADLVCLVDGNAHSNETELLSWLKEQAWHFT